MKIKDILKNEKIVKIIGDISDLNIENLACDTKSITKNTMFFCLVGSVSDGHDFAGIAKEKGAVAIVCERPLDVDALQIIVENTRASMSRFASNFYNNPMDKLKIVGITGTNGKTTTTYLCKSVLEEAGFKVGVIGTIGVWIDDVKLPATLTTPDPIVLHSLFRQMVNKNVDVVVMEVSAHAISLCKMDGIVCDVGAITNITEDHLDFFKTFDNYKNTKLDFLSSKFCKQAVVNMDDKNIQDFILKNNKKDIDIFSFGLDNPCDVFAVDAEYSFSGTNYFLNLFDEILEIKTKLIGRFNVYNALCCAVVCKLLGVGALTIKRGLNNACEVDGRFNVIDVGNNRAVVIDYAHTPDGLKNILLAVKQVAKGKVVSVFGCGGNRDTIKRPIMGKISGSIADYTIITTDNPRLEQPEKIILQIEKGVKSVTKNYLCIENRVEAVGYALKMLKPFDVMVLSGKGAEDYLDIGGVKYPYSDYETVVSQNEKIKKEKVEC